MITIYALFDVDDGIETWTVDDDDRKIYESDGLRVWGYLPGTRPPYEGVTKYGPGSTVFGPDESWIPFDEIVDGIYISTDRGRVEEVLAQGLRLAELHKNRKAVLARYGLDPASVRRSREALFRELGLWEDHPTLEHPWSV